MKNTMEYTFDHFLMERWGEDSDGDDLETRRLKAFHRFWHTVRFKKIASRQTIKKWFALDGFSLPSRDHILRLGLTLYFSVEETEQYLTYGISEPRLQVNDYKEFAAMYCLDHKLGYSEYETMVSFYELETENGGEIRQTAHTDRILDLYRQVRKYGRNEFAVWMCKNAELFKGYSRTTYDYFCSLMDESLLFFREEMQEILERTLSETDFDTWAAEQGIPKEERRLAIRRYVKNRQRGKHKFLSKPLQREIRELYLFAYSSQNRLCDLLIALGMDSGFDRGDWEEIRLTNRKYISDLLSVSLQKRRQMELHRDLIRLKKREEAGEAVKEERKRIRRALTMQSQRVRIISRSDLLLLIQYVMAKRYQRELEEQERDFDRDEAKEQFINFANTILLSCGMREMDEQYRLDAALLSCIRTDEVLLLSELLQDDF